MPSRHARATFTIDGWDSQPFDDQEGAKLSRTRLSKTFQGDLQGHSSAEMLMAEASTGAAAYAGFERISGRLHGSSGSFVLHHNATMSADGQSQTLVVLPGSGTGELASLSGRARIDRLEDGSHTFAMDYDLA